MGFVLKKSNKDDEDEENDDLRMDLLKLVDGYFDDHSNIDDDKENEKNKFYEEVLKKQGQE